MEKIILEMISFFDKDPKRVQHFLKVYEFARLIGKEEHLDAQMLQTLEVAAVVHDIGIRVAEEKLGYSNGSLQQQYGPAAAEKLLSNAGLDPRMIQRVCFLVGHHHTYTNIDQMDYQILVEADFLVNILEEELDEQARNSAYHHIFKTATGKQLFEKMYGVTSME